MITYKEEKNRQRKEAERKGLTCFLGPMLAARALPPLPPYTPWPVVDLEQQRSQSPPSITWHVASTPAKTGKSSWSGEGSVGPTLGFLQQTLVY